MKNNSFKSAQHGSNWVNLQIKKKNKKQPVKVFTAEEKMQLAAQLGVGVSTKQPTVVIKEEEIDYSALPQGLLQFLNK